MTYSIFVDTDRNAAILVNDDPPYALGPVLVADNASEAIEALEAFCEALENPPDQIPTIQLMTEWSGFLGAITGNVVGVVVGPDGGAVDGAVASTGDLVDAVAAAQQVAANFGAGIETAADNIPETPSAETPPDDSDAPGSGADEGAEAAAGSDVCWFCKGSGSVDLAGTEQVCGICHGTGKDPTKLAA